MRIHTLVLHQVRRYERQAFSFLPGLNSILGPNATGKTTVLEAIYYLMTGRSFRAKSGVELVRKGADGFVIEAGFVKNGVEQTVKAVCRGSERKIYYNKTLCPSALSLLGVIQGVVATPDDIALVKGAPALRRQYLDLQLAQADPLYVHHLARYHRAMSHRNVLLRAKSLDLIETWEREMALSAAYVVEQRRALLAELNPLVERIYASIADEGAPFALAYRSTAPDSGLTAYYQEGYRHLRRKEFAYGHTLLGPHKDDIEIEIGGLHARRYASEGQQRSGVVALRFAEWERLLAYADEPPLMLLDDITANLDGGRRRNVFAHFARFDQVFLTGTDAL